MNTKAALLDNAETLARQRGFDGFSFADLEAAVGIRKASVHYHFPTKGDLSFALMVRYAQLFADRLDAITASHSTAAARLLAYLDLYRQALDGGRSLCLCVALSATQTALPDTTRDTLDQFHHTVTAWLEAVFRLALTDGTIAAVSDPRAEAAAALAQVEGAQIMGRAARGPAGFEAAISTLRARAL
ncbi:TetR/AcrR family transcriptional regulator [uncultured Tateyamaria sp.]|uniref:TetR/AcrR family transcriptional regulator n=1 Tax=Tateyamaria sp. 1078 TaxID=3417464 RepID=UPI002625AFEB|nr:TetR/AcrR family transcriptional regulator [uncultured Tateyamaria sp.]